MGTCPEVRTPPPVGTHRQKTQMRKTLDSFLDIASRVQRGPEGERVAVTTNRSTGERSLVIGLAGHPTYSVKLTDVAGGAGEGANRWMRNLTAKCEQCRNLTSIRDLYARADMSGVCPRCAAGADAAQARAVAVAAGQPMPAPVAGFDEERDPVTGEA